MDFVVHAVEKPPFARQHLLSHARPCDLHGVNRLRRLSPAAELLLITLICFAPFAVLSIAGLLRRETVLVWDDRRLFTVAAIDLVCGAIAILILRARGWTRADLGLRVSMPLTIAGMLLFIGANITIASLNYAFIGITGTNPANATTPVVRASWLAVVLLVAIDPLFEEVFEVAYVMKVTENHGAAFGMTLSAAIRLVCHLWQGPVAALTILPLGIIFAAVYWKWRRVWPLVVAHGAGSWFALAPQQ